MLKQTQHKNYSYKNTS